MIEVKPTLRGYFHQLGFIVSLPAAAFLLFSATSDALSVALVYVFGLCGLLGTSALYHRVDWSPVWHARMRKADHMMIFVLIASSFTPFAVLVLNGPLSDRIMQLLWYSVALGFVLNVVWPTYPKWVRSSIYVTAGWSVSLAAPQLLQELGPTPTALMLGGGLSYTIGALFYASRRPNFVPGIFGYHELFHVFVLIGAALHYWAIFGLVSVP